MDQPDGWTLTPTDQPLIAAKSRTNRLSFAVLLLFFRAHGRFPRAPEEIEPDAIVNVERQLGNGLAPAKFPDVTGRSGARSRRRTNCAGMPSRFG